MNNCLLYVVTIPKLIKKTSLYRNRLLSDELGLILIAYKEDLLLVSYYIILYFSFCILLCYVMLLYVKYKPLAGISQSVE